MLVQPCLFLSVFARMGLAQADFFAADDVADVFDVLDQDGQRDGRGYKHGKQRCGRAFVNQLGKDGEADR